MREILLPKIWHLSLNRIDYDHYGLTYNLSTIPKMFIRNEDYSLRDGPSLNPGILVVDRHTKNYHLPFLPSQMKENVKKTCKSEVFSLL